jgi:hypothetical protein
VKRTIDSITDFPSRASFDYDDTTDGLIVSVTLYGDGGRTAYGEDTIVPLHECDDDLLRTAIAELDDIAADEVSDDATDYDLRIALRSLYMTVDEAVAIEDAKKAAQPISENAAPELQVTADLRAAAFSILDIWERTKPNPRTMTAAWVLNAILDIKFHPDAAQLAKEWKADWSARHGGAIPGAVL